MKDDNGRWDSRQMGDERESVSSSVFRTRAGESELFGKLKVGRASLGEEVEGLEGCGRCDADIINACSRCLQQQQQQQQQCDCLTPLPLPLLLPLSPLCRPPPSPSAPPPRLLRAHTWLTVRPFSRRRTPRRCIQRIGW